MLAGERIKLFGFSQGLQPSHLVFIKGMKSKRFQFDYRVILPVFFQKVKRYLAKLMHELQVGLKMTLIEKKYNVHKLFTYEKFFLSL